jgi:integrase
VAHVYQLKSGQWRAQVARAGVRKSDSFTTKAKAVAWATMIEAEILAGRRGVTVRRTLRELLERYRDEESPKKRGGPWEVRRIDFMLGEFGLPFADRWLTDLLPEHFAAWRDARLKGVRPSSVNRDFNVLSAALRCAVREWRWLPASPLSDVRRPRQPPPRNRLIGWREIRAMLAQLGYRGGRPKTKTQEVGHAFLVSLHTGMRASEVLGAELRGSVAHLAMTKNGSPRDVPLSARARRIVAECSTYTIDAASLDALFRKHRKKAGLEGFTFHDARATALTRMSKKVDVLTLARISGHKDINELLTYYRETPQDVAKRLR